MFEFSYVLTDADPNKTYTAGTGGSTAQILTDETGSSTGTIHLKHGDTFIIENLPEGAKITVTEIANDHTAEYWAVSGDESYSGKNDTSGTALLTQQLTVKDGSSITFTNTKNETTPVPTGVGKANKIGLIMVIALSAALYAVIRRKKSLKK